MGFPPSGRAYAVVDGGGARRGYLRGWEQSHSVSGPGNGSITIKSHTNEGVGDVAERRSVCIFDLPWDERQKAQSGYRLGHYQRLRA